MTKFAPRIAFTIAMEGHLISPQDAHALERSSGENAGDWEARLKLLGFYHAHQLCCPQTRSRRIENLIWAIDNAQEIGPGIRSLLLAGPGDRLHVPQIREAFQRRIDAAPYDPISHKNMGDFLQAINPGEACPYYEKALSLGGDDSIESSMVTAKLLERHGADTTTEDYGENMTCIFDVLQAGDQLLKETCARMQPSEADWNRFFDIAHGLIWNQMLLCFAQFGGEEPVDSPASTICKSALRQMYETLDADSEEVRTLTDPKVKALWDDLVH